MKKIKAIFLAAGYATRLYPLTENFPKPLLEVGGKPILDWLVEDMESSGLVEEYLVVSNHRFAPIFEKWAASHALPITVVDDGTSTNETRLGAVRDIQVAVERQRAEKEGADGPAEGSRSEGSSKEEEDVLVLAGDNVLSFSLVPFIRFSLENNCSCVMCYEEEELARQQRTAIITVDEEQRITSYEEKPKCPRSSLAVPPFYFYKSGDVSRIPEALQDGCGADAPGSFAAWLSARTMMKAYRMPGRRYDIGNRESYERVRDSYRGIEE